LFFPIFGRIEEFTPLQLKYRPLIFPDDKKKKVFLKACMSKIQPRELFSSHIFEGITFSQRRGAFVGGTVTKHTTHSQFKTFLLRVKKTQKVFIPFQRRKMKHRRVQPFNP